MSMTTSIESLQILGFIFAILFLILGSLDGIYFHLVKYKLHKYKESQLEHHIHCVRGLFLGLIGALIFSTKQHNDAGISIKLAVAFALIIIDLTLEVVDIYVERDSRKSLGGISSTEMVLHVFASSFRMASLVLLMIVAHIRGFPDAINLGGMAISASAAFIGLMGLVPVKMENLTALTFGSKKQGVTLGCG